MDKNKNELYGFSINDIARLCGVNPATAARWKSNTTCMPESARRLLSRDLGVFDPAWAGWTISAGQIVSPEGLAATPGDVLGIQFTQMQLAAWRAETLALRAQIEAQLFEEQPLPDSWEYQVG